MPFLNRPHFENRQIVQYMGEPIELSGQTTFDLGQFSGYKYDTYSDFLNGVTGSSFTLSAATNHTVYQPGVFRVFPPRNISFSGNTNVVTGSTQVDVTGYVLTSLDSSGTVIWALAGSGATDTNYYVTGSTLSGTDLIINRNGGLGVITVDLSTLSGTGAFTHTSSGRITPTNVYGNTSSGDYSSVLGGSGNTISSGSFNVIVGGENNVNTHNDSVILGSNLTSDRVNTTFTEDLTVRGVTMTQSLIAPSVSLSAVGMKGRYVALESDGTGLDYVGDLMYNINRSGSTGTIFGDLTSYPTLSTFGNTFYGGSGYTRGGSPTTGLDGYRNKVVLATSTDSNGTIFALNGLVNRSRTWAWESNSSSLMVLNANLENPRLGVGLDPTNMDILPDATLQLGWTGGSATFKYIDGNQSNNYVLTSDNDGNATWQASTGGGGGVTIDPYEDLGTVPAIGSITWDVSGTSTNYEAILSGNTTLDLTNVRNGDYGTIVLTQDGVGSHTLTLNNVNGGAGTHKVINGGGGTVILTSTGGASDVLTFTYNGSTMWWSVGYNYT